MAFSRPSSLVTQGSERPWYYSSNQSLPSVERNPSFGIPTRAYSDPTLYTAPTQPLGGELNNDDRSSESWYNHVSSVFNIVRDYIVDSLYNLLTTFCDTVALRPTIVHLSSSIISLITTCYATSLDGKSFTMKALMAANLVTAFTSFITSIGQLLAQSKYSWLASAATYTAKHVVNDLIDQAVNMAVKSRDYVYSTFTATANELKPETWIKIGVASIVAVLFAGLGLTNAVEWRDLIQKADVLDRGRKTAGTVSDIANFLLKEVCGIETEEDYCAIRELEELIEEGDRLTKLSPAHYVQEQTDFVKLQRFTERIMKVTARPMSKENSSRYHTTRQLLIAMYKVLIDKQASVTAILETKDRQATFGVLFSGKKGVGKSEFAKYLSAKVAQVLGYYPGVYVLNKKDQGFYEPYGGQAFGLYNEWMALRSEDPLLRDFNLICSSDPVNFEGASLECKVQPNRLKLLFLTANVENPDLTYVLNEGAAEATWDRIYHIRMEDPKCRGRKAPNPHRLPDFTHCKFYRVDHEGNRVRDGPVLTVADIINRCVGRVAEREIEFLDRTIRDVEDPQTRLLLDMRKTAVRGILATNSPYDSDLLASANAGGREFFVARFQGQTGYGKTQLAEYCAAELSSIFRMPFQKSTSSDQFVVDPSRPMIYLLDDWVEKYAYQPVLERMNQTHDMSMFLITSNTVFKRERQKYGLSSLYDRGFAYFNNMPYYTPFDGSVLDTTPGMLRRLGLQGPVRTYDGDVITVDENITSTFTFTERFVARDVYGQIGSKRDVLSVLFKKYRLYASRPAEILVLEESPSVFADPGVSITAGNITVLLKTLKSMSLIIRAVMGNNPDVTLKRSTSLYDQVGGHTTTDMWLIPYDLSPKDDDELADMFIAFCTKYRQVTTTAPLYIHLVEEDKHFYYVNNVAYIYGGSKLREEFSIEVNDDHLVFYRDPVTQFRVAIEAHIAYKKYGMYIGPFLQLELSEIIAIDRYVSSILHDDADISTFKINYNSQLHAREVMSDPKFLSLCDAFKKHPIFWIGCGLLFIAASGYGLYMLSKLLWNNKDEDEEDDPDYDFTDMPEAEYAYYTREQRRRRADKMDLLPYQCNEGTADDPRKRFHPKFRANEGTADDPRKRFHPKFKANKLAEKQPLVIKKTSFEERKANQLLDKLEVQLRPDTPFDRSKFLTEITDYMSCTANSDEDKHLSVITSDQLNTILASASYARHCYGEPSEDSTNFTRFVHSNMLSYDDMIRQEYTPVEQVHKSLTKLYYKVINQFGGKCYGVGLFGKYILTVSHMFDNEFDPCTIQSNGEQYPGQCVYINRERDLSVVRVIDKAFPNIANTKRHFHNPDELEQQLYGFFLRPGPDCEVMGGYLSYHSTSAYPITDPTNKNFRLSQKMIVFTSIGCHKMRDFVKRGDCGFPLVFSRQGTYKIIGLHNSYAEAEKMHFSSFTSQDHHDFLERAMRASANDDDPSFAMKCVKIDPIDSHFLLPQPYVDAFSNLYDDYRYSNHSDKLYMLGFSPDLALRSRPKLKIHKMDFPGMLVPLYKLPAAFTDEYVTDFTNLAKDTYGDPDPLFTQCVKYDRTIENTFDMDIFREAMDRMIEDTYARYGDCKFLRTHEVINGKHLQSLSAFDPTTSAGPLLKMCFGITNKLPLFDTAPNQNNRVLIFSKNPASDIVHQHYNQYTRSLLNGGPPPLMVSKDCAKVELITAEKAAQGKVRLFNEVDLSINMVLKKFFGDLQNKVMDSHLENPIKMGQNPYRASTSIWRQFAEIQGEPISTDFSAFDKQLSPYLIMGFCKAASVCYARASAEHTPEEIEAIYTSLWYTLTYVVHTCRGSLYLVDRGNESGTFVTTMLNSFSVRLLTMYTLVRKWHDVFRFTPTLADLNCQYREAIYGDDRTVKISAILGITESDFIVDSALFGLKCTPAKTSSGIDFCSRAFHWDAKRQVCFPALKKESVLSLVRWFKSVDRAQIIDNIDCCLFEAALHPDFDVFDQALGDIKIILQNLHIPLSDVHFYSRDVIRARFVAYVYETEDYEWLTHHSSSADSLTQSAFLDTVIEYRRTLLSKDTQRLTDNIENCPDSVKRSQRILKKYLKGPRTAVMADPRTNPISAVLEALAACKIQDRPIEDCKDEPDGSFKFQLTLLGEKSEATGLSKREAKKAAYAALYQRLSDQLREQYSQQRPTALQANASAKKTSERYMYGSIHSHLSRAHFVAQQIGRSVIVLVRNVPKHLKWQSIHDKDDGCIRYSLDELSGSAYVLSSTSQSFPYKDMHPIYAMQPGTEDHGEKITVGSSVITANMDAAGNPGPALTGDSMSNPGITTNPKLPNPVDVSQSMPAMTDNLPPSMGALEPAIPQLNLNPSGPPNMLSAGAIAFDLKDLIYSQMIDCDEMFTFTDDTPEGSVLFQIPYDPTSKFVNKFIKAYLNLHTRFAGNIKFRINVVGNQTFSGYLAMCWLPHKYGGTVIPISEAMKYNYLGESINQPFGACFDLGDARQHDFYRLIADNADVDTRPHLLCFVLMAPQSPFREGIKVRVRIASQLQQSFQFADPNVTTDPPKDTASYGLYQNSITRLIGQSLVPVVARPYYPGTSQFHIVVDGNTFSPRTESFLSDYQISGFNYFKNKDSDIRYQNLEGNAPPGTWTQHPYYPCCTYLWLNYSVSIDTSQIPNAWQMTINNLVRDTLKECKGQFETALTLMDKMYNAIPQVVGRVNYNILANGQIGLAEGTNTPEIIITPEDTAGAIFMTAAGYIQIFTNKNSSRGTVTVEEQYLKVMDGSFANITQCNSVAYKEGAEAMPAGWRRVAITPDLPLVAVEALVSGYMQNHPSLFALLSSLEVNIQPNQVIQVELADFESTRSVTTLRYLPDRQTIVMNVNPDDLMFATSMRPCERMYITQVSVIERTNAFPITTLSGNFADNQIHPDVVAGKLRQPTYFR